MNMISQLRQRVQKEGATSLSVDEYNQLQTEWITRTPIKMPDLDDEVKWILGRPNFTTSGTAAALRKLGRDIPEKSEEEQAATIYYYLSMYLKHGAEWREKANAELAAA